MTKVDREILDRIEKEDWRRGHPGWLPDAILHVMFCIMIVTILLLIFIWSNAMQVQEVEAAVFHKEEQKILYVEKLDSSSVKRDEFPPEAIEVNTSSSSDAESEIETSGQDSSEETEQEWVSIGRFRTTGFCNCRKCCGKWAGGKTASGSWPKEGVTIAVDKNVIPMGTEVLIDGIGVRVAQDTGSGIYGKRIDVYYDNHSVAWNHGVQYHEVFIKK